MTMRRWVDWVNLLLGLWLVSSPWVLTLETSAAAATLNMWIVGSAIASLAAFSLYKPTRLVNMAGIALGAWLVVSPWVLGFAREFGAATNVVLVGILIIGYALWATRIDFTLRDFVTA